LGFFKSSRFLCVILYLGLRSSTTKLDEILKELAIASVNYSNMSPRFTC